VVLAASWALDAPVARRLATWQPAYSHDLYEMFRLVGYWPVWTLVAIAFGLIDRGSPHPFRRAATLWTAVTVSGIASEVIKLLIRRERPDALGAYVFRSWRDQPFATGGLGMPSGHASIAFAAMWTLSFLYPRAGVVWVILGAGCAFTRMTGNSHFVSDIAVSCVFSYAIAREARDVFAR
jgi:membrane-associated phospholipid phosphatase